MRFKENREDRFTISLPTVDDPVLVACPGCQGKASILPHGEAQVRCSCLNCGFSTETSSNGRLFYWYDETPTDGYFGLDLWLQTRCMGNSLWAFNRRHLTFLEAYVSAELRERDCDDEWGWSNASLASRLPKWIKSGKNRDALLRAINELKSKV